MNFNTLPDSPERKNSKEGVYTKELQQSKYEVFSSISKSPEIKSSLNKISNIVGKKVFEKEWKEFEKVDISKTYQEIIQTFPESWLFLSDELWLDLSKKKFSQLDGEEKIVFTALYKLFQTRNGWGFLVKKSKDGKEFRNNFYQEIRFYGEKLNDSFVWTQRKNLWNTSKTLKEYWLTEKEIQKFTEYLKLLEKQPKLVQEAGIGGKLLVGLVIFVAGAISGAYVYDRFTNTAYTEINSGEWEIRDLIPILETMFRKAEFSKHGTIKKEQFTVNDDDNFLINIGKDVVNTFQSTEISMNVEGEIALKYDFKDMEAHYQVTRDPDGKEIVKAYLNIKKQPEVVITSSKAKVLRKNRERVQLTAFNQAELELKEKLEGEIIDKAYKGDFYTQAFQESQQELKNAVKSLLEVGINRDVEVIIDIQGEKSNIGGSNFSKKRD